MNIFLWVLQGLIAVHTAIGAVWKFSHSPEQTMPSLKAIPPGIWLAMSGLEILISLCLIAPVLSKTLWILVPVAASLIVLEMFVFTGFHIFSGNKSFGPIMYWLVIAALSALIAYGRAR